jgi:YegS/Rv2252/BmrU family lipid kinase
MGKVDKWFLVCNPIARSGKMLRQWPKVQKILATLQIDYEFCFTESNNHAIRITREKISEGYRKFAVLGGDGTLNEVVNGIMLQEEVNSTDIKLAVIPLGTANDWAKTHGIPSDLKKAVPLLKDENTGFQDVGIASFKIDGDTKSRYFNNVAGMSYDAFVVKYMEDYGNRKMNKLKYIYYVIRCLFMFQLPEARVSFEDQVIAEPVYTVNVGICKYSGGGLRLVPQAIPNDGKFALTIASKLSKWQVILNMYRFYTGTLGNMKQVSALNTSSDIKVDQSGDDKVLLELDGEFMGYAPASFTLVPDALTIVIP